MYGGSGLLLNGEFLVLPLLGVLPLVAWWMRRDGASWRRVTLGALLTCHATVLIGLTFFPLPLPPYAIDSLSGASYLGWPAPWASIVPFTAIGPALGIGFEWPAARYLVGNVVAFMPLGVLVPLVASRWDGWLRALVLGLLVSGAIELSQLGLSLGMGFAYRVADVDDLLLNALGAMVGYGVLVALRAIGTVRYRAH